MRGTGACTLKIVEGQNIFTATFSTLVIHVEGDLDIWHPLFFSVTLPIASYDLCKVDFGDGTQEPCIPLLPTLTETTGDQAAANGAASITVSANHIYAVPGTHKVVFAAFYHGGTSLARLTITISAGHTPLYFPSIRTQGVTERGKTFPPRNHSRQGSTCRLPADRPRAQNSSSHFERIRGMAGARGAGKAWERCVIDVAKAR